MREIQSLIHNYVLNYEKQKKYISVLIVLSILVSFAVPFILMSPADSMSGQIICSTEEHLHNIENCYRLICNEQHEHSESCFELICEKNEHLHTNECYGEAAEAPESGDVQSNGEILDLEEALEAFTIFNKVFAQLDYSQDADSILKAPPGSILGVANNFHIFAEEAAFKSHVHGNIATNLLLECGAFGVYGNKLDGKDSTNYIRAVADGVSLNNAFQTQLIMGSDYYTPFMMGMFGSYTIVNKETGKTYTIPMDKFGGSMWEYVPRISFDKPNEPYINIRKELDNYADLSVAIAEKSDEINYTSVFSDQNGNFNGQDLESPNSVIVKSQGEELVLDFSNVTDKYVYYTLDLKSEQANKSGFKMERSNWQKVMKIKGLSDDQFLFLTIDTGNEKNAYFNKSWHVYREDGTKFGNGEVPLSDGGCRVIYNIVNSEKKPGDENKVYTPFGETKDGKGSDAKVVLGEQKNGTFLCPRAYVNGAGNTNGTIIAYKFVATGETHRCDIQIEGTEDNDTDWSNPLEDNPTISITVNKMWSDGASNHQSDSITVQLYEAASQGMALDSVNQAVDGQITLNASNNWSYTWTGLSNNKYYYVKEISTKSGYVTSYSNNSGHNSTSTVIITNTKEDSEPQNIAIIVNKVWNDGESVHSGDSAVVKLYYANTANADESTWKPVEGKNSITLNKDNNWTAMWDDLEKSNNVYYFVKEESYEVSNDAKYEVSYSNNGANNNTAVTVTNSKVINIKINKVWSDGADIHENESITIQLYKADKSGLALDSDELAYVKEITLNKTNDWKSIFENLPVKDENGNQIYYYVKEKQTLNNYEVTYSQNGVNMYDKEITVTNTKLTSITVQKEWKDANNNQIASVTTIQFEIYKYKETTTTTTAPANTSVSSENKEETVTTPFDPDTPYIPAGAEKIENPNATSTDEKYLFTVGNDGKCTISNLPTTEDGCKLYYYVKEVTVVDKYNPSYSGNGPYIEEGKNEVITNTKEADNTISVTVNKSWFAEEYSYLVCTQNHTHTDTCYVYVEDYENPVKTWNIPIKVKLQYRTDGDWIDYSKDGQLLTQTFTQRCTFVNLPNKIDGKDCSYRIVEVEKPYGYKDIYQGGSDGNGVITANSNNREDIQLTNSLIKNKLTVRKSWFQDKKPTNVGEVSKVVVELYRKVSSKKPVIDGEASGSGGNNPGGGNTGGEDNPGGNTGSDNSINHSFSNAPIPSENDEIDNAYINKLTLPDQFQNKQLVGIDISGFDSHPDYKTVFNLFVSDQNDNYIATIDNGENYSNGVLTKTYDNKQIKYVSVKTTQSENFEKAVLRFSDGSTYTINNTYTPSTPDTPSYSSDSLVGKFGSLFKVGTAVSANEINTDNGRNFIKKHFNSITPENELKPEAILVQSASQQNGNNVNPQISLSSAAAILKFCEDNGIGVRGHTFIWHSQTPDWFFRENFSDNGNYVSKEVMNQRIENFIKNTFEAIKNQYPKLNLYAYDVCNELFLNDGGGLRKINDTSDSKGSNWARIYGENNDEFVFTAFRAARKYAPSGCKLYINDYNEYISNKTNDIYNLAIRLKNEGLIDGIGMQSHLDVGYPDVQTYKTALEKFLSTGLEVSITELDITTASSSNGNTIVNHTFNDNNQNGWQGNACSVSVNNGYLVASGRNTAYQGPQLQLNNAAGKTYNFSAKVSVNVNNKTLKMTVKYDLDGNTEYHEITRGTVSNGTWINLTGAREIPSNATNVYFYFEELSANNDGQGESNFDIYVDDVIISEQSSSSDNIVPQDEFFKAIFQMAVDNADKIPSFTVWGTHDTVSWRKEKTPLLFGENYTPKDAYDEVMSIDVPSSNALKTTSFTLRKNVNSLLKTLKSEFEYGPPTFKQFALSFNYSDMSDPINVLAAGDISITNDFENDYNGWNKWGNPTLELSSEAKHSGNRSLKVYNRNNNNSAVPVLNLINRDSNVSADKTYSISVWVYLQSGSNKTVKLTHKTSSSGDGTYEQIAQATAQSGQWVELKNTSYSPTNATNWEIYVEIVEDGDTTFYIDDFTLSNNSDVKHISSSINLNSYSSTTDENASYDVIFRRSEVSDLSSKTISNVKVYFKNNLNSVPDTNNFNLWAKYNNNYGSNKDGYDGKVATYSFANNPDEISVRAKDRTEIEKFVISFTDGSTYTRTNSNYVPPQNNNNNTINIILDENDVIKIDNYTAEENDISNTSVVNIDGNGWFKGIHSGTTTITLNNGTILNVTVKPDESGWTQIQNFDYNNMTNTPTYDYIYYITIEKDDDQYVKAGETINVSVSNIPRTGWGYAFNYPVDENYKNWVTITSDITIESTNSFNETHRFEEEPKGVLQLYCKSNGTDITYEQVKQILVEYNYNGEVTASKTEITLPPDTENVFDLKKLLSFTDELTYSSSNTNLVQVDSNGIITTFGDFSKDKNSYGNATVTVRGKDGKTLSIKVNVGYPADLIEPDITEGEKNDNDEPTYFYIHHFKDSNIEQGDKVIIEVTGVNNNNYTFNFGYSTEEMDNGWEQDLRNNCGNGTYTYEMNYVPSDDNVFQFQIHDIDFFKDNPNAKITYTIVKGEKQPTGVLNLSKDMSINKGNDQTILSNSELGKLVDKEISKIEVNFLEKISGNYDEHFSIWVPGYNLSHPDTFENGLATLTPESNLIVSKDHELKANIYTDDVIDSIVVYCTDGSTYTINNTNKPLHKGHSTGFTNNTNLLDSNNGNYVDSYLNKNLTHVDIVYGDTLLSLPLDELNISGNQYSEGNPSGEDSMSFVLANTINNVRQLNIIESYVDDFELIDVKQIIMYYDDGSTYTIVNSNHSPKTEVKPPASGDDTDFNTGEFVFIKEIELLFGEDWTSVIENLPATDGQGNAYEYYIKEKNVYGSAAEDYTLLSYTHPDGIVLENNNNETGLTNAKLDEIDGVLMPSTGGKGIVKFYLAGMAIILSGIAGHIVMKRRLKCRREI